MKRNIFLFLLVFFALHTNPFAETPYIGTYVYSVTEDDTKDFKATEEIFKILEEQIGLVYADTTSLIAGIEAALTDYPDKMPYIRSAIRDTLKVNSLLQDQLCAEDSDLVCPVAMLRLDSESVRFLKKRLLDGEKFRTVPPLFLEYLDNLTGIFFPDSVLFRRYAASLLIASMGLCTSDVDSVYSVYGKMRWTNAEFDSAMVLWRKKSSATDVRYLMGRRRSREGCSDKVRKEIQLKVEPIALDSFLLKAVPVLRKYYAFKSIPPVWKGDGCGCAQKEELDGEVYGFFPYWKAYSGDGSLDFSAVSRIAYYGISVDDSGRLRFPASSEFPLNFFSKSKNVEFIQNAHKHNVRVDWTIGKNRWENNPTTLKLVLDTLSKEIIQLITPKLPSTFRNFVSRFTYEADEMNFRGDGVTLYFQNYPKDSVSTKLFNDFFLSLKEKLRSKGDYFFVNMLVSHPDLVKDSGIYSFKNFRNLLHIADADSDGLSREEIRTDLRSFLLVIMDEPLLRTKRDIYRELDEKLRGDDHRILMQSLTPVIWFDNKQWDELRDEIDFYADAFYNIGFASYAASVHPAIDSCVENGSLASCILKNFEKSGASHQRQTFMAGFVCSHRWLFRLAHVVVCCLSFVLLLGCFAVCRFRAFVGRKLPLLIALLLAPPICLSLVLLLYDPALMVLLRGNYPLVLSALFVFLVLVGLVLFFTYDRDLPMRRDE